MNLLGLGTSASWTVLHGVGIAAPYKGAKYLPKAGKSELVEETIELALEGTATQLLAATVELEGLLTQARATWRLRHPKMIYLVLKDAADDLTYQSEVRDGWIERERGSRPEGSMIVKLHLVRVNCWKEDAIGLVNLTNDLASGSQVVLQNHNDAGHNNWVEWAAADIPGGIPTPIQINLKNTYGSGSGEFFLGLYDWLQDAAGALYPFLEGENASGGSASVASAASAACSNGYYKPVTWAGAAETQLLTWAVSTAAGYWRNYRALIRFGLAMAYTDLWLRVKLLYGSQVVWEGPQVLMTASMDLQELATLQLPPALAGWGQQGNLTLGLYGKRAAGGTLAVDYLALAPADGWLHLITRGAGLGVNEEITIDGDLGNAAIFKGGGNYISDYTLYGAPLLAKPGIKQRLYVFSKNVNGLAAEADRTTRVSVAIPTWVRTL